MPELTLLTDRRNGNSVRDRVRELVHVSAANRASPLGCKALWPSRRAFEVFSVLSFPSFPPRPGMIQHPPTVDIYGASENTQQEGQIFQPRPPPLGFSKQRVTRLYTLSRHTGSSGHTCVCPVGQKHGSFCSSTACMMGALKSCTGHPALQTCRTVCERFLFRMYGLLNCKCGPRRKESVLEQ